MSYLSTLLGMTFNIPDVYARRNRPIRQHCQALDSTTRPAVVRTPVAVVAGLKYCLAMWRGLSLRSSPENLPDYFEAGRSVTGFPPEPGRGDFAPPAASPLSKASRPGYA